MFTRSRAAQIPDFIPEGQEYLYPQSGKNTADFVPDAPLEEAERLPDEILSPAVVEVTPQKRKPGRPKG